MARNFLDNKHESWSLAATIPLLKRIREQTDGKVDFLQNFGLAVDAISGNVELLVQVLYLFCEAEIAKRRLTEEDFAERLTGDVFEQASNAAVRAVIDFFHPSKRALMETLLDLSITGRTRLLNRLQLLTSDLGSLLTPPTSGDSSTNGLESAG